MKYSRLTKEQFESLHQEFINFLATQSITAEEWKNIKEMQPEVAEEELDVFSDLVWEGALSKAEYVENISARQLFLFKLEKDVMKLIGLKITNETIDITTREGYTWLQQNYASDDVEFFTSSKEYSTERNTEIFALIEQGSVITKGELYEFFSKIINV